MKGCAALSPTTSVGVVEADPAAVTRKTMAFRGKDRHMDSSTYFSTARTYRTVDTAGHLTDVILNRHPQLIRGSSPPGDGPKF